MELIDLKKQNLPDTPGVYFFKIGNKILYIGKATSLRDRVRSYFMDDLINTRGPAILDMVLQANKITFKETDSVLEALILETLLIKKHQPKYNVKEKDDKSYNFVIVTKEDFPKILLKRERELMSDESLNIKKKYGPFPSTSQLQSALKIIRKIFPFYDEKKGAKLNVQIGITPDPNLVTKKEYRNNIRNIELFFENKKSRIIKSLKDEMTAAAKSQNFEKAAEIKKQIFALNHLNDVSLLMEKDRIYKKREDMTSGVNNMNSSYKIESFDISHTAGSENVGAMVVMIDGEFVKNLYRKFIIKKSKGGDDVGSLKEILERRLKHSEWSFPNLIVVDGGKNQRNVAQNLLKNLELKIPVVSVLKNEQHKPIDILGPKKIINVHKDDILKINNETHRFVIKYHREKRGKSFL